ncbi:hypothetical protein KKA03_00480 [archaeon]|nr:hypothetical protein [archaeon]
MDKDKALKNMTDLLLAKARMLQYHCGNCKSPLFEKEEKIICPVCGEMKVETEEVKEKASDTKTSKVLVKKRDELLLKIEKEKNPKKLTDLLEALEKLNKLL